MIIAKVPQEGGPCQVEVPYQDRQGNREEAGSLVGVHESQDRLVQVGVLLEEAESQVGVLCIQEVGHQVLQAYLEEV